MESGHNKHNVKFELLDNHREYIEAISYPIDYQKPFKNFIGTIFNHEVNFCIESTSKLYNLTIQQIQDHLLNSLPVLNITFSELVQSNLPIYVFVRDYVFYTKFHRSWNRK